MSTNAPSGRAGCSLLSEPFGQGYCSEAQGALCDFLLTRAGFIS
ncbi:hypothetical protein EHW99_1126 [Erwinia amylovora]|uniref:Uncharacterized protein n=2 Tax=Erwinia amylovora TaxID=552 RepID=A0A830ZUJ0_ERWAM|nr:hypothetical protein EHX00_1126 [Erwinia amylovora]CBA21788.1 hypothetical protein predicted by Glimmer/Critica [Erwinia amylovora CFBP1430]CCO79334.1 hypothetical protein BN432_2548 [Erwinia amylovora Ea356]CCO83140.1 hypothetical protein BN433_2581 [Erwinia amylovora Ea266]CCO90696.1 hypothetical protein BN435_2538 [Erwinia amylovora 01SFR-BO]CCO94469.1 hypothetical protein BN437_2552 [Erwinia amylovora NBRC 12687 = CFBP 1232]CCO99809.1 hypothetical protein BN438_2538 [Erwinia amylovora 